VTLPRVIAQTGLRHPNVLLVHIDARVWASIVVKLSEVTDLLLDFDSKELEVYIGVASIESMAFKIYIELSARWEPKFGVAFR